MSTSNCNSGSRRRRAPATGFAQLVGNAIKFTEQGGVAVIAEQGDDENEVRFEVRDTGIGLKDEDIARISDFGGLTVPPLGNSTAWDLRSPSASSSAVEGRIAVTTRKMWARPLRSV